MKPRLPGIATPWRTPHIGVVQAGASESFARLYAEMTRAFNEGRVKPRKGRTSEKATPTRFEDFAEELARAYQAG